MIGANRKTKGEFFMSEAYNGPDGKISPDIVDLIKNGIMSLRSESVLRAVVIS